MKKALTKLHQFGIIQDNTGVRVYKAKTNKDPKFYKASHKITFWFKGTQYKILLKQYCTNQDCYDYGKAQKFEISISYNKNGEKSNYLLQKDKVIPKSKFLHGSNSHIKWNKPKDIPKVKVGSNKKPEACIGNFAYIVPSRLKAEHPTQPQKHKKQPP